MNINALREKMENVPFGNSIFQTLMGIPKEPARAYRHILLQINTKLQAFDECRFRRARLEVDIDELRIKIEKSSFNEFDKKRFKIDLEEKCLNLRKEEKLIRDAGIELLALNKTLEALPEISRIDFEQDEKAYWKNRLLKDSENELIAYGRPQKGTLETLESIGIVAKAGEKGIEFIDTDLNLIEEDKINEILSDCASAGYRKALIDGQGGSKE